MQEPTTTFTTDVLKRQRQRFRKDWKRRLLPAPGRGDIKLDVKNKSKPGMVAHL
jgi:hypothetical protein